MCCRENIANNTMQSAITFASQPSGQSALVTSQGEDPPPPSSQPPSCSVDENCHRTAFNLLSKCTVSHRAEAGIGPQIFCDCDNDHQSVGPPGRNGALQLIKALVDPQTIPTSKDLPKPQTSAGLPSKAKARGSGVAIGRLKLSQIGRRKQAVVAAPTGAGVESQPGVSHGSVEVEIQLGGGTPPGGSNGGAKGRRAGSPATAR